jgi:plastocyanin
MRKVALSLVALALAVVVPSVSAAPFEVLVKDNFFKPKLVEIKKDRKVTWVWKGTNLHNVAIKRAGTSKVIKRSALKDSGKFTYQFTRTGTFRVICEIHEKMTMKVVVRR